MENKNMEIVNFEDLPPAMQKLIDEIIADKEDCLLMRNGEICGRFHYRDPDEDISLEMTPEEEAELLEDIRRGDAEFAAGRFITLDEFKVKYADRLRGSV